LLSGYYFYIFGHTLKYKTMPLTILENLWKRTTHTLAASEQNLTWHKEMEALFSLGISMEDTVRYLYFEKPDLETFMAWIDNRKRIATNVQEDLTEDVLSKEDLDFWNDNGYVVVKNAIPEKDCEETQTAIWNFLGMNPDDKAGWYRSHEEKRGLMLNFSDHETLNKNRFSPRIKKAYEQLYQTTKIHKTIDKVSFNPPETDGFHFMGSPLHWDTSLKLPIPFSLQGLVYLTDCGATDGAFHCVPGFHNKIEDWLRNLDPSEKPRYHALMTLEPVPVTGNAGDLIIWQNTLPHCATPNHGATPRMVQYITYLPDDLQNSSEWI